MATDAVAPAADPSPAPTAFEQSFQKFEERVAPKTDSDPQPKADSATAKEPSEPAAAKADGESAPAPEAGKETQGKEPQKPPQQRGTAETRIKELLAENKKLADQLKAKDAGATQTEPAKSSTAKPAEPQIANSRPKPKLDDVKEDGTPKYAAYDDYMEDLTDWKAESAIQRRDAEQQQRAAQEALNVKLDDARKRYANLDEVIKPAAHAVFSDEAIPAAVKEMVNVSPVLPDLLYVIGGDQKNLQEFTEQARRDPAGAIRKLVLMEQLILEELAGGKSAAEKPKEKTEAKEPAHPQRAAIKPVSEVGGRGTAADDPLESAAQANDFRSFKTESDRRALASAKR